MSRRYQQQRSQVKQPQSVQFQGPSLGSSLVTGLGLGIGSSLGGNLVNSMFGSGNTQSSSHSVTQQLQQQPINTQTNICQQQDQKFAQCINTNSNNIQMCQSYIDELKNCRQADTYKY